MGDRIDHDDTVFLGIETSNILRDLRYRASVNRIEIEAAWMMGPLWNILGVEVSSSLRVDIGDSLPFEKRKPLSD